MSDGGKLKVETRLASDSMLAVVFTDDAEPADAIKIEQMFDPFAGNRSDGLGLGLSVSQEIIRN